MKTTIWFATALSLASALRGQTDIGALLEQYAARYTEAVSGGSSIPVPGEVTPILGKPYSAVARTVENSPDGVHIDRAESNRVYRDDRGRTRRELNGGKTVSIVDPVGNAVYTLQTESRTAVKRSMAQAGYALQPASVAPIRLRIVNQLAKVLYETVSKMAGIDILWDPQFAAAGQFSIDLNGGTLEQALDLVATRTGTSWKPLNSTTIYVTSSPQMSLVETAREQAKRMAGNVTVDDLGTQVVNGVTAQGVRITALIPTGTFGNDHELKTVTERWVSENLHVLVRSVYSDSRTGSTVYDLLNISRTPPDPSLFQVPAGYTMQEGGRGGRGGR